MALAAFTTTAEPFAQSVPTAAPSTTAPVAPPTTAPASTPTPPVTLNGYAEVFYSFNLNQPSSGITAYRAFDNRHNAFTISNVVLDGTARLGPTWVRVAAQVGHTPETYYLGEPSSPAAGGVGASDANVWKYLQQAYVGVRVPVGTGLRVEADIFLSPVGVEFLAVKDSWNWSRSTLFYSLPYYHTGVRATYDFTPRHSLMVMGCNGWTGVLDNNDEKSAFAQYTYSLPDRVVFEALYGVGVERPQGAPEGRAWRHMFEAGVTWQATQALAFMAQVNAGVEPNAFGTSAWGALALYARVRLSRWLSLAARGDALIERAPRDASLIFWGLPSDGAVTADTARWVGSATGTVDFRPFERASIRLEYRHDLSDVARYFAGDVATAAMLPVPVARSQDTLTLVMTAWF